MRAPTILVFTTVLLACTGMAALAAPVQKQQGQQQFTSPVKPNEADKKFPVKAIWVLKEFNNKPLPVSGDVTLEVDENFRGSGASGCNTWSATIYPSRGQRLGVGPIALTHNTCDATRTALEHAYLTAIHSAPFWDMEGSDLVLKGPGGILRFQRSI